MPTTVAITRNEQQGIATHDALEFIRDDLRAAIFRWEDSGGKKQILIKPNLLSTNVNHACNTSVETCLAVANYFKDMTGYKILVGDGTTYESNHNPSTMLALKNHGYEAGQGTWQLVDLHADEPGSWFKTINHETPKPVELGIARLAVESFVVSVAKIKTHDVLGLTLCLKNMMGTLNAARFQGESSMIARGDVKGYMHGFGNKKPHALAKAQNTGPSKVALAANIIRLVSCRSPDLAVIDGSTVMEGLGPRRGNACGGVSGFSIASTDAVAVDATCAAIASIPLDSFQYVRRAMDRGLGVHDVSNIAFKGAGWQSLQIPLKRHPLFSEASPWKQEEIEAFRRYTEP